MTGATRAQRDAIALGEAATHLERAFVLLDTLVAAHGDAHPLAAACKKASDAVWKVWGQVSKLSHEADKAIKHDG